MVILLYYLLGSNPLIELQEQIKKKKSIENQGQQHKIIQMCGCLSSRKDTSNECEQRHKKYVFIIGTPGSGQSELCQQLQKNTNSPSFEAVPEMDLDREIEIREQSIEDFQKTYNEKHKRNNQIISLIVSVKFERTDIMKRNLLSVIKYFRRFIDLIIIVVTYFDQSENLDEDKENLKKSLKFLVKNDEERIFFSQNQNQIDEIRKLLSVIEKIDQNKQQPFSLKDTIFEEIDDSQNQNMYNELFSQLVIRK